MVYSGTWYTTYSAIYTVVYNIKIKIHSSCELKDFVGTHICKLCVILRSRVLLGVSSLRILVGDSRWNYSVACTRVNRVMLVSLCAETLERVFEGDKI